MKDLLISVSLQNVRISQFSWSVTWGAAVLMFIYVTWELCVRMPTGILQEAPRPHRQDRRGTVRHRGQSAEGRQRGELPPTGSRRPSRGQEAETKSFSLPADRGPEDQGGGSDRREETRSEESSHVRRHHAEGSAGLQAHGQHGPEVQPEAGQEGGEGGGECVTPAIVQPEVRRVRLYYWNEY